MKKIFCVLMGVLYSLSSLASYNLDDLNLEGLWQLKDFPSQDPKEKILYDFKLGKSLGADPGGFRLSYFKNQQSNSTGISGIGLFVLPSCRQGRFNYFLRLHRTDESFQLFEIIHTRGYPEVSLLHLQKSGSPKIYTLEKVRRNQIRVHSRTSKTKASSLKN